MEDKPWIVFYAPTDEKWTCYPCNPPEKLSRYKVRKESFQGKNGEEKFLYWVLLNEPTDTKAVTEAMKLVRKYRVKE